MKLRFLPLLLISSVVAADEQAGERTDPWRSLYKREAEKFEFERDDKVKLEFQANPVMHWVSLRDFRGDVFLWSRRGRPEVVGSFFSWPLDGDDPNRRRFVCEFHSLSTKPLKISRPDRTDWHPRQGLVFQPLPNAPVAAGTAKQRRLQLRPLSRSFAAHMERNGERWELRLLSQPLYQWGDESPDSLGGGLIAFVGFITDPEVLLVIEAVPGDSGPEWQYAPVRFTNRTFWIRYQDKEIYSSPKSDFDARTAQSLYWSSESRTVTLD